MSYAIIGAGAVGQALAKMFARKKLDVAMASTRSPEAIALLAENIGPTVVPRSMEDALNADLVMLAVPFWAHREIASAASWQGKIVVDVTNAYGISPTELDNLPSSVVISKAFTGAMLVKAFNHLPAKVLAEDPSIKGGRRVVFLSSDDESAAVVVAALAEKLGFAPIKLGGFSQGGLLIQARGETWAPLIFQDLFKLGQ